MAEEKNRRRLAAIMAVDVVGYSRLMRKDEAGTLAQLKAKRRDILAPIVGEHGGRVVKVMGDGVLIEFGSAVEAVSCAVELQERFGAADRDLAEDRRIVLRIGINLGDVIVEGYDLYGDGVNVAARLQALAEPGGICVSGSVREQVGRILALRYDDLGPQTLKNIDEPVSVYRVRPMPAQEAPPPPRSRPSIAVLPFANMSSDADQDAFADGLTEDLITDLSRNAGLFVIARNSTFAFRGKSADARRIATELGVRFLLEGSVRRAAARVRVNAQLIDGIGGGHLWADRFDRDLQDIFAVQDEITARIVEALIGRLAPPADRQRPSSIEAYDLCVRARQLPELSPQEARTARSLLGEAIRLDPNYAEAHRWLAFNLLLAWLNWGEPQDPSRKLAIEAAERSVALDPQDAGARWTRGYILAHERRWDESDADFAAALALDPNHADAWAISSDLTTLAGNPERALEQLGEALRLNPFPPAWYHLLQGQALYAARRYEESIEILRRKRPTGDNGRFLAAGLAQLGRIEEARWEAEAFLLISPHFRTGHWASTQPIRDEATRAHFVEGYLKAGLPE